MERSFIEFINKTPPTGKSVLCTDNNNIKKILKRVKNKNIVTYGENSQANYKVTKIKYHYESTKFDLSFKDKSKSFKTIKNINTHIN